MGRAFSFGRNRIGLLKYPVEGSVADLSYVIHLGNEGGQ